MVKDRQGFLWILSPLLVQRFDGVNCRSFPVMFNAVDLAVDSSGQQWLAASNGIYHFGNDYTGFIRVKHDTSLHPVFSHIAVTRSGQLIATSTHGLYSWNTTSNQFVLFSVKGLPADINVTQLLSIHNDIIFFAVKNQLYRYDIASGSLQSLPVVNPRMLTVLDGNRVLISTWDVFVFSGDFNRKTVKPLGASGSETPQNTGFFQVYGAAPTPRGDYLVVSSKKVYRYNPDTMAITDQPLFLQGNLFADNFTVNTVYANNDEIWVATESSIIRLNTTGSYFGYLRIPAVTGLNNWVRDFAEDPSGLLWFATSNGLGNYNKTTGAFNAILPGQNPGQLRDPSVRALMADGSSIIIGLANRGIQIFNTINRQFSDPVYPPGALGDSLKTWLRADFINGIIRQADGNYFIYGVQKNYLLEAGTHRISLHTTTAGRYLANPYFKDHAGRIWFCNLTGNEKGMYCYGADWQKVHYLPINITDRLTQTLMPMAEVGDSIILCAALGVKAIFKMNGTPAIRDEIPALSQKLIRGIYHAGNGNIWITSSEALYHYNMLTKQLDYFDYADNIQGMGVVLNTFFKDNHGVVFLGGQNGINFFNPAEIARTTEKISPIILRVMINQDDSTWLLNHPATLQHHENSLVFEFVAPFFSNSNRVRYRYMLEGADKDWVSIENQTTVRFTALKPGQYTFRLAASLDGNNWIESAAPYQFRITPPFWKTNLFYSLILLMTAALVYLFIHRREKRIREKEKQKTEIQSLRASNYQYQFEMSQVTSYFANSINNQQNTDDLLWDIAKNCIATLGFEDCVIYLKHAEKNVLVQKAAWGDKSSGANKIHNPIEIPFGKGIVGTVAQTGQSEMIGDTSLDQRYIVDDALRYSEIAVPIMADGKVIGVIDSENPARNFYTERHLQILTTIASMCADRMSKLQAEQLAYEKEREVLQLSNDLAGSRLSALRAQMNPHFLFNALNSIQQFTLAGDTDQANLYISKFSTLLRSVLQSSGKNFITLEEEINQISLYLDIEKLRMGHDFTYDLDIDEELETDAVQIPVMLIQPFVENALKHGLATKEGDKQLVIRIAITADSLNLQIADNGIGRKKADDLRIAQEKFLPHESSGIRLVRERLQLLYPQTNPESLIRFEDHKDPTGTTVIIQLPLHP